MKILGKVSHVNHLVSSKAGTISSAYWNGVDLVVCSFGILYKASWH